MDAPTRLVSAALLPQYEHHNLAAMERLATAAPFDVDVDAFLFLRHGQTNGNLHKVFQPEDIPLNENGLAQADRAAGMLDGEPVDQIYASPMVRAFQTAQAAARATGAALAPEEGLKERWFGDLVGTSSLNLDWGFDPPNGERLADFVTRIRETSARRLGESPRRRTMLVAHGGVLYALAFSLRAVIEPVFVENATPLRFTREAGRWIITPLGLSDSRLGASGV